jgi:toxin YoeB
MIIQWAPKAIKQAQKWHCKEPKIYKKLKDLIKEIEETPFTGTAKPEPLKHGKFKGWWSRRISQHDRLIYRVSGKTPQVLEIASCKGHYD